MQLCQDPSPAAWARIAYASIRDTLSVLNYKNKIGGDGWIRTTALFRGQIYSLVQSTTLPRLQIYHIGTHYIELADYLPTTQRLLSPQLHTIMCFYIVSSYLVPTVSP